MILGLPAENIEVLEYNPLPTIERFHQSTGQIRCIIGPVGSGKTSGAALEVCYYLPHFIYNQYGIKSTRWVVIRNSYRELADTTAKSIIDPSDGWFPNGKLNKGDNIYSIKYENGIQVEILFRSCDRAQDLKKFKSLQVTGYWIDESIEVADEIKRMLKTRIGRYPKWQIWAKAIRQQFPNYRKLSDDGIKEIVKNNPNKFLYRFGIETSNPPDVEHTTYSQFKWDTPPPGPIPPGAPLPNHIGFWQPPRENESNLTPNYYDNLINDYKDNKDWADMYVQGKPGIIIRGKLIYANFNQSYHVAQSPLIWSKGPLFRGWDNSGNCPACVVAQIPTAGQVQILKEFHTDRLNIVTFTQNVVMECNNLFPGATFTDWADPAGNNEYSTREGAFTSNAKLMAEACNVHVKPSEQNLTARINAVDDLLGKRDGLLIDPGCTRLINGFLGGYCYREIGTSGVYSDTPWKNKFSHVHDSTQYLLVKITKNESNNDLVGWTPTR